MIEFADVRKRYPVRDGYKTILHGLSMQLPKRNIAILGENGAGKSTLLRLISGSERPDAGEIKRQVKISFPLGFAGSFNGSLSGYENATFVARIYGQDTDRVLAFVREFSQLGEHLHMPVRTFSSGMRARLAFGVSLAVDFECYLVDEITAVGDSRFQRRSKEAFKEKLKHANIIMVSHSDSTLRDYCDMGAVLHEGRLTLYDNLVDAISHHNENQQS
jgi:capsular polysaccharide transport system ATP-binding protein